MIDHGLKLYEDGTLQITMPKGAMVRRVLVDEEGSHFCEVMYPETGSGISEEPTYEQVLEYCNKRCLALVSEELLAKLPSAQPELTQNLHRTCTDAISRQDAKDVVDMELDAIDHVPEWVYDRLLTALDKVPSAEPEQLEKCPIYGGVCLHPSDQCYACPRHAGAEPIIRCTNCRFFKRNIPCTGGHYNGCEMWLDDGNEIRVMTDDYCSKALPKEGEQSEID